MPLKIAWAADTAAPNGEASRRRVGWYLRDWRAICANRRSSRRHWEQTGVRDERISPVADAVRAPMLNASALQL